MRISAPAGMDFAKSSLLPVLFLLASVGIGPQHVRAETCTPACQSGYTCQTYNGSPACVQGCANGGDANNGCTVDEVVVTATKKPAGANFASIVAVIVSLVNGFLLPLLYALAFVFFLAGLVRFLFISNSEEDQESGKKMMLYGTIGLVVLFGVWGIVNVVLSTIGSVVGTG